MLFIPNKLKFSKDVLSAKSELSKYISLDDPNNVAVSDSSVDTTLKDNLSKLTAVAKSSGLARFTNEKSSGSGEQKMAGNSSDDEDIDKEKLYKNRRRVDVAMARANIKICSGYYDMNVLSIKDVLDYEIRCVSLTGDRVIDDFSDDDVESMVCELRNLQFEEFCSYVKSRIFGYDSELDIACYHVWSYLRAIATPGPVRRNNFIISGISGSGKTEFMRVVSDFMSDKFPHLGLRISRIDMSSITEAGFKGVNFDEALIKCYIDTVGLGIVFLDEFDKKLLPSYSGKGCNVNAAVQGNLLMPIEGCSYAIGRNIVDTRNTLFIALGTFDKVRERRVSTARTIGYFGESDEDIENKYWDRITEEDVLEQGAKEELLGRFADIVNFGRLNDGALSSIIEKHVHDNYESNRACIVKRVHVYNQAKKELFDMARNSKRGVRDMLHKFDAIMRDPMIRAAKQYDPVKNGPYVDIEIHDLSDIRVHDVLGYGDATMFDYADDIDKSR